MGVNVLYGHAHTDQEGNSESPQYNVDQRSGMFFREIDSATTALELRAGVATNSKTFARQTLERSVKDQTEAGMFGTVLEGRPVNALQTAMQSATGRTPADKLAAQDEIFAEISKLLTGPRGPHAQDALAGLSRLSQTDARVREISRLLGVGGATGLALPAHQYGVRSLAR